MAFSTQSGNWQLSLSLRFLLAQNLEVSWRRELRPFSGLYWSYVELKSPPYANSLHLHVALRFPRICQSFSKSQWISHSPDFPFKHLFILFLATTLIPISGSLTAKLLPLNILTNALGKKTFIVDLARVRTYKDSLASGVLQRINGQSDNNHSLGIRL